MHSISKGIIKLMPDYQCFPIWKVGLGVVENISPTELPITTSLAERLTSWQNRYDKTLNLDDPYLTGFESPEAEVDFDFEGVEIWKQLITELKGLYETEYFSVRENKSYSEAELSNDKVT